MNDQMCAIDNVERTVCVWICYYKQNECCPQKCNIYLTVNIM